jgi:hypothetical protein
VNDRRQLTESTIANLSSAWRRPVHPARLFAACSRGFPRYLLAQGPVRRITPDDLPGCSEIYLVNSPLAPSQFNLIQPGGLRFTTVLFSWVILDNALFI